MLNNIAHNNGNAKNITRGAENRTYSQVLFICFPCKIISGDKMDCIERERLLRLGLKVSYYRKIKGMSVDNLADKTDLSVSTIQKLESPTLARGASLSVLWRISDVLDIHISKLLSDDNASYTE